MHTDISSFLCQRANFAALLVAWVIHFILNIFHFSWLFVFAGCCFAKSGSPNCDLGCCQWETLHRSDALLPGFQPIGCGWVVAFGGKNGHYPVVLSSCADSHETGMLDLPLCF